MFNLLIRIFSFGETDFRGKVIAIYALLVATSLCAWIWALIIFRDHPMLLGTALLDYSIGLRYAVDVDHIAAIDNVTRKLFQEHKRPVTVDFFFAMGHSAAVILSSIEVAATSSLMSSRLEPFKTVGGVAGKVIGATKRPGGARCDD